MEGTTQAASQKNTFFHNIGLPKKLLWAFLGLFLFILGAAIEQSWFSSYLSSLGISSTNVSLIFTVYGIAVAIVSWFTGIGTQSWGIRPLMWAGAIIYFIGTIPLIWIALPAKNYILILIFYTLRGFAYPLFAYSFLVWINYSVKKEVLGRASSWFWIFFGLGMTIVGPYVSSALLPVIGKSGILYLGMLFVLLGTLCALVMNRDHVSIPKSENSALKDFSDGFLIMFKRPRLGVSVIVKAINDVGKFGFVIIMPIYLIDYGFSTSEWLAVWGSINVVNIFFNYVFGYIGDKIGWRKTVTYFSGTLCGLGTLGMLLAPRIFGHNIVALFLSLCLYAIGLSAFGPLSALVPNLAPDRKGDAISALNLGSGLSNFVGPLIVSIFIGPFGSEGALIAIAVVYLLASVLAVFLKTPEELKGNKDIKRIQDSYNENVEQEVREKALSSESLVIDADKFAWSVLESTSFDTKELTEEQIAKKKLTQYLISRMLIDKFNCLESQDLRSPQEISSTIQKIKFTP